MRRFTLVLVGVVAVSFAGGVIGRQSQESRTVTIVKTQKAPPLPKQERGVTAGLIPGGIVLGGHGAATATPAAP